MWRKRMQDLSRGVGKPHAPLFAPLLFGVAAQIEAIPAEQMRQDGTRIRKNVGELRGALGLETVLCSAPHEEQLVAAGQAQGSMPESVPGLAAALDAVRQWQAQADEPVIAAAFHGPGRIYRWHRENGVAGEAAPSLEQIGDTLAAWVRAFAEAGVHVVQWYDTLLDDELTDAWKGALGTAGNVARFHRVASVLILDSPGQVAWPPQAVACPTSAQHPGAMPKPHGRAWPADPLAWLPLPGEGVSERLITTAAEVPSDIEMATLMDAMRQIREA